MSKFHVTIFKRIRINLLFFVVLLASIVFNYYKMLSISYLSAFLHELSHILVARLLKIKISHVEIQPFGIGAVLEKKIIKSPSKEAAIAIVGPISSFFMGAVYYLVFKRMDYVIYCNLGIGIINLLPILPLDGGRITRAFLTSKLGIIKAYNIMTYFSRISAIIIVLTGILGIVKAKFNFSLILIGIFMVGSLLSNQYNISRETTREFLNYKTKLDKNQLNKAKVFCAFENTMATKILRELSYDRYYVVYILDEEMKIVKTLTEGQILNAIENRGVKITLGKI